MGFSPVRSAKSPGAGRQNLFRTQPQLQWRLLYARNPRSFHRSRRGRRTRANFVCEGFALLTRSLAEKSRCSVRSAQRATIPARVLPTAFRRAIRESDDDATVDAALRFAEVFVAAYL